MLYYIRTYKTDGFIVHGGFNRNAHRLREFIRYQSYYSKQTIDVNYLLEGGFEYEIYKLGAVIFL